MDCIFCKIIKAQIPAYIIYEDKKVLAFLDIHPESNGHLLIIPKKHFLDLDDIDQETLTHIYMIAKKLKLKLEQAFNCDGILIFQNNGVGQDVKHFHIHLKPIYQKEQKLKPLEEIYNKLK